MKSTKYTFSTRLVISLFVAFAWIIFGSIFFFSREPDNSLQSVVSRADRVIAIVYAGNLDYWWVISEPSNVLGVEPITQINYMPAWDKPKESEEAFQSTSTNLNTQEWRLFDAWRDKNCRKQHDKADIPNEMFYTIAIRCGGYADIQTVILLQKEIPSGIFGILSQIRTQSTTPSR